MTIYKKGVIVSAVMSVLSLIIAGILHYCVDEGFWWNVLLGVFGSALLTFVTSMIGYKHERRMVMEEFYTESIKLINKFNRYQTDLTTDQKIDFFLDLVDYDTTDWSFSFGKMDFFRNSNRKYIYEKIYCPLHEAYDKVRSSSMNLRMHKNGTGRNEAAMDSIIDEIEKVFLEFYTPTVLTEDGEISLAKHSRNVLFSNVHSELCGRYYDLMYNKKKEEDDDNGKA